MTTPDRHSSNSSQSKVGHTTMDGKSRVVSLAQDEVDTQCQCPGWESMRVTPSSLLSFPRNALLHQQQRNQSVGHQASNGTAVVIKEDPFDEVRLPISARRIFMEERLTKIASRKANKLTPVAAQEPATTSDIEATIANMKKETCEDEEEMEVYQPNELPSSATVGFCDNDDLGLKLEVGTTDNEMNSTADSQGAAGLDKQDSDTFKDRILEICRDLNAKAQINNFLVENEEVRDEAARKEEQRGIISLHIIGNTDSEDGLSKQIMKLLIDLKNVYSHQLPKMPREYITRLVFDISHKHLVLIKKDKCIGGICFRMFPDQGFSEIVFCAISAHEQVKGYGSHLMNHVKDYHIRKGTFNLLTYADHNAVGYFKKQGFTEEISIDKSVYIGYLKHYKDAKLMHCELDSKICYTMFSAVLRKQKDIVKELAKRNQDKMKDMIMDPPKREWGVKLKEIPGMDEVCQIFGIEKPEEKPEDKPVHDVELVVDLVLSKVMMHPDAWPFRQRVDKKLVPDYYHCIPFPMDLKKMTYRLKDGYYMHKKLFIHSRHDKDVCQLQNLQ